MGGFLWLRCRPCLWLHVRPGRRLHYVDRKSMFIEALKGAVLTSDRS